MCGKLGNTVILLSDGREIKAVRRFFDIAPEGATLEFEIEALEDIAKPVPLY